MTLDLRSSGEALRAISGDLARVWRSSRYTAGAPVFPGMLDGIIEDFLGRVGEVLLLERPPEEAWGTTCGVVRLLSPARSASLLAAEWTLTRDVLLSACDALEVAPEATATVRRAVEAAENGVAPLLAGDGPGGILPVRQLGGFRPRGTDSRNGGRQ